VRPFVRFERKPSKDEILARWAAYEGKPHKLNLPSAPRPFIVYFQEDNRPQTKLDRDAGGSRDNPHSAGMGITIGRLRDDRVLDYRFVCLSHNTIRGAAGGAVLTAELLKAEGYITAK
jgi:aspartate-semialdehyde dehydrogenase